MDKDTAEAAKIIWPCLGSLCGLIDSMAGHLNVAVLAFESFWQALRWHTSYRLG